ncbi:unnamed protein product [Pieris brassicae]|uniref:Uncharacterized protein n=1 Tax=Pieris brassicae TaxID=7116 RepID=A0A9P0TVR0_PIEBR|nr:unnamed protein product [Pieris brassicae]
MSGLVWILCAVVEEEGIDDRFYVAHVRPRCPLPPCLPVRNDSPSGPLEHPPPPLKASGELQEKVPRVYTHMRRTIFGARLTGKADYVEKAPASPYA